LEITSFLDIASSQVSPEIKEKLSKKRGWPAEFREALELQNLHTS